MPSPNESETEMADASALPVVQKSAGVADQAASLYGAMRGTVTELGDIVSPLEIEWMTSQKCARLVSSK